RGQVWQAIAESRNIGQDALDGLADTAPLLRDLAVESGLIDRVGFRDEAYARVAELVGAEDISPDSGDADGDDAPPRLYLSRYARATGPGGPARPSIPGRGAKGTIAVGTRARGNCTGPGRGPF